MSSTTAVLRTLGTIRIQYSLLSLQQLLPTCADRLAKPDQPDLVWAAPKKTVDRTFHIYNVHSPRSVDRTFHIWKVRSPRTCSRRQSFRFDADRSSSGKNLC